MTGECTEKYTPQTVYAMSKTDLELLYEQAKSVVLQEFCTNEEFKRRLIDSSTIGGSENGSNSLVHLNTEINRSAKSASEDEPIVPQLNLTSSTEPRENIVSDTDAGYYFSNSLIENNIEQSTEHRQQKHQMLESVVETIVPEVIIQREEQLEEIDASCHDEIQSDITEDSLNKPMPFANENANSSEIQTDIATETNESDRLSKIISTVESDKLLSQAQNMNSNSTQLIENTPFPETAAISSVADEVSATNLSSTDDQNYTNENFEDKYHSDEVSTKIATVSPTSTIATATVSTATPTTNQLDKISSKTIESDLTMEKEPSKGLEHRLILLDDGLRDLSEAISQSPVLQTEMESTQRTHEIDENKTSVESLPSASDSDNKTIQSESASENLSEMAKVSPTPTTENGSNGEDDITPQVESDESADSIAPEIATSTDYHSPTVESAVTKRPFQYTLSGGSIDYNKVPEADALKRAPAPLEIEVI